MILMIINGFVDAKLAAACGGIWVTGKLLYGIGYKLKGPSGRHIGGLISHLGDFPLFCMNIYHGLKMTGYLEN